MQIFVADDVPMQSIWLVENRTPSANVNFDQMRWRHETKKPSSEEEGFKELISGVLQGRDTELFGGVASQHAGDDGLGDASLAERRNRV